MLLIGSILGKIDIAATAQESVNFGCGFIVISIGRLVRQITVSWFFCGNIHSGRHLVDRDVVFWKKMRQPHKKVTS